MKRIQCWLLAGMAMGGCAPTGSPSADIQAEVKQAAPDVVLDWNNTAQNVIVLQNGRPPFVSYYWSALVHLAMYDAVNSMGGAGGRYQPFAVTPTPRNPASREAAAVSAAYNVLVRLPGLTDAQKQYALDKYNQSLSTIADGTRKNNGIAVGADVATQLLALYPPAIPGSSYTVLPAAPGVWEPLPPAFAIASPGFATIKPFLLTSNSQFRVGPPPALTSDTYTTDFNEQKQYGGVVSMRTSAQTDTGLLFVKEAGGAQYARTLRRIAQEHGLTFTQNIRLFAMWYAAAADSQIVAWDSKFHYNYWRPLSAIRRADTDGNDATVADPTWSPATPTPGHPEYPSAHCNLTGAITETLRAFFGTDQIHIIVDTTVNPPFISHTYQNLQEADDDVIDGRVYGGMHFRNSNRVGLSMGQALVHALMPSHFQRLDDDGEGDSQDRVGHGPDHEESAAAGDDDAD